MDVYNLSTNVHIVYHNVMLPKHGGDVLNRDRENSYLTLGNKRLLQLWILGTKV